MSNLVPVEPVQYTRVSWEHGALDLDARQQDRLTTAIRHRPEPRK